MHAIQRRTLLVGATALAIAGCNSGGGAASAANGDDVVLGQANAPVTLLEYYSVMCPHCKEFHELAWAQLKRNYIDTGKVKFIFREVPTGQPVLAVAGFQLARCGNATADQYTARVEALFAQQDDIFNAGGMEAVRQKFIDIGAASNLSADQVTACLSDPAGADRVNRNSATATTKYGQNWGTPLLELNGTRLDGPNDYTYEGLSHALDAALAAHH